jgi:hypothetical protein
MRTTQDFLVSQFCKSDNFMLKRMFSQVLSKSHVFSSFPKNEFAKLQNIATKKLTSIQQLIINFKFH